MNPNLNLAAFQPPDPVPGAKEHVFRAEGLDTALVLDSGRLALVLRRVDTSGVWPVVTDAPVAAFPSQAALDRFAKFLHLYFTMMSEAAFSLDARTDEANQAADALHEALRRIETAPILGRTE